MLRVFFPLAGNHPIDRSQSFDYHADNSVVVFEKKTLLDAAIVPEQTERNRIPLPNMEFKSLVDMNASCLVFIHHVLEDEGKDGEDFDYCKKDLWMSTNV